MIDTHCHLTFPDFQGKVPEILDECLSRDVTGAITISTTTQDCLDALALAQSHERIWCSSGIHPLHCHEGPHDWSNLEQVARHPKCVAWGELGLDYHYDGPHRPVQHEVVEQHLDFIESMRTKPDPIDLPVILHCREAFAELVPILRTSTIDPTRFVFHCFTGDSTDARLALDLGAMISFTGVVTYKNAPELRQAAKLVPSDRIMVETDSPFLSPEPHRGTRPCRPAFTRDTAERLATLRGVPFDTFHQQLNQNTQRFFNIDAS